MQSNIKSKILNALLIITSLLAYLRWGGGNEAFLFQMEGEILGKLFSNPKGVLHPFTILPLIGQILLLITLFQKTPGKKLTYIGIACISLLLMFIFVISLISLDLKILLFSTPFLLVTILTITHHKRTPTKYLINLRPPYHILHTSYFILHTSYFKSLHEPLAIRPKKKRCPHGA